jgi:antitoxin (DNA-binding transcriptional repressor) of toxin-antitoxin stability system
LLERVEKGESITITKHGRPVARLVPAPLHARRQVPDRVPPTPEEHVEFMRRHQERAGVALYPLTP